MAKRPVWHPPSQPGQLTLDSSAFRVGYSGDGTFDESTFVEFKTGVGRGPVAEVVTSFSNTSGGNVLVGVANDGEIVGRTSAGGLTVEDAIHQAITTVRNPGRYHVYDVDVDGRPVTVLAVEPRREGFAQTSDGRVLYRRGKRNVPLYGAELANFVSRRLQQAYESTETSIPLSRADGTLVDALIEAYGWNPKTVENELENRLTELGLVYGDNEPCLTVAGGLLCLEDPTQVVSKSYIEVLRYRDNGIDYDLRHEVVGCAHEQVLRAAEFVTTELGTELVVIGVRRHEIPRLPSVVIREAIANAIAHRSYEMAGSAVRVELRPDVVIVKSPGGLIEPVTVENIRDQQAARNPSLISVLRRFGLAEDAGRGVDVMEDTMATELLDPPTFEDDGRSVTVRLPIRSAVSPAERAWVKELYDRGDIEPADRLLLVHAARGERLTNKTVRALLHVDSTEARQALTRLRDLGYLSRRGQRGGTSYVLAQSLSPPAGLHLSDDELLELIEQIAAEQVVTNQVVRDRTGLEPHDALRLLNALVEQGRLVRLGERRGTRYVLPSQIGRPD